MKRLILASILLFLAVELALAAPVLAFTPFWDAASARSRTASYPISHPYSHGERDATSGERPGCLLT